MPRGRRRATVVPVSDSVAGPHAVFVAECYAPASGDDASAVGLVRVGAACADLRAAGAEVVYLGALIVPDDELAFHVFVAPDAGNVKQASRRAGLRVERVVQSVAFCLKQTPPASRKPLPVGDQVERPVAHAPREIGP
jgi:hypothetical protein